jgi:predicted ATP-grasp superfamily ATP-dependent carboligase
LHSKSKTEVPVLAFGSGLTLLGTLRCLGRAGIPVHVASPAAGYPRRSRWCRPLATPIPESPDPAALADALRALPFERAVLMPCTDTWSAAVAGLPAELADRFPASISSSEVQGMLVDKARFSEALRRFHVPHPHTLSVRSVDDLESLPESCFARAFLKPCDSQHFSAKYGVKAFRCTDRKSAALRYEEVAQDGLDLMLQEYIPGPATSHYFLDGFVDRDGRILAAFARRRLRMNPPDFGNSSCMISVPIEEVGPAIPPLEGLLQGLRFRGIFSVEFKRDSEDGAFKLLDLNARPWWYIEFAFQCGMNMPRLAYRDALRLPVDAIPDYRAGRRCVFIQRDWGACRRLFKMGELSRRAWVRDWLWSEKAIAAWDDPLPAFWDAAMLVSRRVDRVLPRTGIFEKLRARATLLPEALHARRSTGRSLLAQCGDLLRLRMSPIRLRSAEYYDFRLYDPRYSMADRRAFAGDGTKKEIHRRLNNKAWEVLMTDKLVQAAYLDAAGLPYARVYAIATTEPRLHGGAQCFAEPGPLAEFLRSGMRYPSFVKPIKGNEGRSCHSLTAYDGATDRLVLGSGKRIRVEEFLEGLQDPTGFGFLFLERLESHPQVSAMCGPTVSSIRMIVLLHDGGPELLHADWGIPAGRSQVSNFAKGETGNLIGGLDLATGRVTRVLGGAGRGRREVELHPISGRRMEGFLLPDWREAVELCLRAATAFPGARWQNWDIALTPKGPVLLELNSSGDVYAAQYLTEKGILAGPLGPFLETYAFREDRKRPLFPSTTPR